MQKRIVIDKENTTIVSVKVLAEGTDIKGRVNQIRKHRSKKQLLITTAKSCKNVLQSSLVELLLFISVLQLKLK